MKYTVLAFIQIDTDDDFNEVEEYLENLLNGQYPPYDIHTDITPPMYLPIENVVQISDKHGVEICKITTQRAANYVPPGQPFPQ